MRLKKLSVRKRAVLVSIGVILLIGLGFFGWAVKTGKIKIRADVTPQNISGVVYDTHGNPLSSIKITDNFGHTAYTADFPATGHAGEYSLINLPTGEVYVTFADKYDWTYIKTTPTFPDVPKSYWAFNQIEAVNDANVLNGAADGKFYPLNEVTRDTMAVALCRAMGLAPFNNPTPTFKDVAPGSFGYQEIEALFRDGDISGTNGYFQPKGVVTRAQLAVFIVKALHLDLQDPPLPSFSDVPANYWAFQYIEALKLEGIVSGYGDGTFRPENNITRDQLAVFMANSFKNINLSQRGLAPVTRKFYLAAGKQAKLDIYLPYSSEMGKVFGQAKSATGATIVGAKVVLTEQPSTSEEYSRTTDANGNFRFYNIPASSYGWYVLKNNSTAIYQKANDWENMVTVASSGITTLNLTNLK